MKSFKIKADCQCFKTTSGFKGKYKNHNTPVKLVTRVMATFVYRTFYLINVKAAVFAPFLETDY